MKNKENGKKVFLSFFILSIFFVYIWFSNGNLFGTAEDSIPFYSPERSVNLYSHPWQQVGTGRVLSFGYNKLPWLYLASLLNDVLPNNVVQAGVFAFIIFTATYSVYLLTKELFKNNAAAYLAGVFYFLNLYTMSQVWARSIYVGMWAWAYLPLFSYLFIRWLKTGKLMRLVYLTASSFVYIWAFAQPGFVFPFVITGSVISLVYFFDTKYSKKVVLYRVMFAGIAFLLFNLWWVYPFVKLGNATFELTNANLSFQSLLSQSTQFPISEILFLKQKFLFYTSYNLGLAEGILWGDWYESFIANVLSGIVFFSVLYGWTKSKRNTAWKLITTLGLVGLFLVKGSNPPLGRLFYEKIFSNFSFTAAIRNPYEKVGSVWLMPYAILFGLGSSRILQTLKFYKKSIYIFLVFGVLVWPFWNNRLFVNYAWIKVPNHYSELNSFLANDVTDGRVLMLPMIPSHGLAYTWGYRGDDTTRFLIDRPAVSKISSHKYFYDKYTNLLKEFESNGAVTKYLDEFNIKYLVLREDVEWEMVGAQSPKEVGLLLQQNEELKFVHTFGSLDVYEYVNSGNKHIVSSGKSPPEIFYESISPVRYRVNVIESKDSFDLIFKESYSEFWEARIGEELLDSHHLVYDYANGWQVNKQGSFIIDIVFKVWPWE